MCGFGCHALVSSSSVTRRKNALVVVFGFARSQQLVTQKGEMLVAGKFLVKRGDVDGRSSWVFMSISALWCWLR